MALRTLSTRIALSAGVMALIGAALLSFVLIRSQREHVRAEVIHGSEALASTVALSIHHEMRVNRRDAIRETFEAVASQPGINGIRLYNKDGVVAFASRPEDVGAAVSKASAECVSCHGGTRPVASLDPADRSRIYSDSLGHPVLTTIRVVRNGVGCQGAQCHVSPSQQSVLGILDVDVSLEPAEARLAAATLNAALTSITAVLLITVALFLLVRAQVRNPLTRMIAATRRVARGDLTQKVPPEAAGEIGFLANSFNEMVESLNSSQQHLEEWGAGLEESVAQKAAELREARFQVMQAEKLSSVGLMAAGIAHELNSPLMAILTFAHLVQDTLPENSEAREDVRMIEREANRCGAIIRQLLDYAREQAHEPEIGPCAVRDAITGALELLQVELQNGKVEVHTDLPRDLPAIDANPVQLMQVFVNLMLNAIQAMPEGGRLTIKTDVVARATYVGFDLPPHPGSRIVRARVRDTGRGIAAEALPKVFDPFFTTKPVGQGSGLGLSVSLGLVRGFRGTILADSDGHHGSVFTVLLPISDSWIEEGEER